MAKLNTKLRGCSQESSVSSLLASGSLSGSRSDSAHSAHSSFVYKDQLYSSASEALQAYIDDFDLSREHPGANAVKVNTDGEIGNGLQFSSYVHIPDNAFVNLDPKQHFNPLYYRRETVNDMDAISLTTDDLLRLPADGCFSFPCVPPDHRPNKKYSGRQDSSDIKNSPSFYVDATSKSKNNIVPPYVYTNINGKKCGRPRTPKPINRENKCVSESSLSFPKESSFTEDSAERRLENYPRWLTSQKSDLSVSGVTSIPDVKYPIWLHNQDLLPEANTPRGYKLLNEDEYRPIHSYQTQRANQLLNKIDCFEYTFKPSNLTDSFSEYEGLGNEFKCQCDNPLLPGQSQKPFCG